MNQINTMLTRLFIGLVALTLSFSLQAQTVYDVIANSDDHNTLQAAIDAANLQGTLGDTSASFTIFAPTDAAFAALGVDLDELLKNTNGTLTDILLYHVLDMQVDGAAVTNGAIVQPLNMDNTLKLTKQAADGTIFVNHARVNAGDLGASNGVVHSIEAVLQTNETVVDIAIDNNFMTLTAAVIAAELLPALTNPADTFTVFAPSDSAFAALGSTVNDLLMDPTGDLRDILLYHVLSGKVASGDITNGDIVTPLNTANTLKLTKTSADGNVFVNQAQVELADVSADNGTVHAINAVVLPVETVVDVAIDNGFTTLAAAVIAAELLPALTDPAGTYTVFAPSDTAFAALGSTVNDLLMDPTGDLRDILLYHVLGSQVASDSISNGDIVTPLNAANTLKLTKTSAEGNVFVNQAQVELADVGAANGTVHAINAVVLPVETVVDVAIDNGFGTLTTAVIAAELLPALTDPAGTYTVFAPNDAAFTALGGAVTDLLMDPTGDLRDILLYHVLGSQVASDSISNGDIVTPLNTANTLKLTKTSAEGNVFVNQAQVELADVGAANGTVHAINAVVLPVETVVDVAIDNGFGTLTTAVIAAELLPALTDPAGTYTVFAPSDAAFTALGGAVTDLLMDPTGDLRDILLYHVLGSQVASDSITNGDIVQPLNAANTLKLTKTSAEGNVFVNQAQVELADVGAANGTVHAINAVVLPVETVVDVAIDNGFGTLTTAVVAAELLPALTDPAGTYTVFAPSDAAFGALGSTVTDLLMDPTGDLRDILLYHVLGMQVASDSISNGDIVTPLNDANTLKLTKTSAEGNVFVNQAQVELADVGAANGTVHAIGAVVLPVETVVDVAIDNQFTILTTAVVAAELLPALTNPAGTFTVFAPTDSAFLALGDTLNDLLADPTGNLANTLLYHVLGSVVTSDQLMNGMIVETLFPGNVLSVDLSDGVKINDSPVIMPDVAAANGVVHVISKVLTPDFPTSIEAELQETPLQVFPNPTTDYVNINAVEANYRYSIFDVTGALQQNGNLLQGSNYIQLNGLSNGTYYVRISNDKASATVRLVVNR